MLHNRKTHDIENPEEHTPLLSESCSSKKTEKSSLRGNDCSSTEHRSGEKERQNKSKEMKALKFCIVLCLVFMVVELIGGYVAHSLAIMTDAAHLLTDVGALLLSYFAAHVSQQPSNNQYTFGMHRAEIIGALASIFSIWFLTGIILYAAVMRFMDFSHCASIGLEKALVTPTCESVNGKLMVLVGILGLIVNIAMAGILVKGGAEVMHSHSHGGGSCSSHGEGDKKEEGGHGHSHGHSHGGHGGHGSHGGHGGHGGETKKKSGNVNVQAAYMHALTDCINVCVLFLLFIFEYLSSEGIKKKKKQSAGVIIAALIIWLGNWKSVGMDTSVSSWYNLADPVISFLFGALTLHTTWGLTQDLTSVLMEGVPRGVNYEKVLRDLHEIPDVDEVHDLHIWAHTMDKLSLSVHLTSNNHKKVLIDAQHYCKDELNIDHATIQVDPSGECCVARCHSSVH